MSRPVLLMFLLMVLIITSQFEWRQQLVSDVDSNRNLAQKQQRISKREEAVKEKIILLQEKSIQKLNELVRSLRVQLSECQSNNGSANITLPNLAESLRDLERQQFFED